MVLGLTGSINDLAGTRSMCWCQSGRREVEAEELGGKLTRSCRGPGRNWDVAVGGRGQGVPLTMRKP